MNKETVFILVASWPYDCDQILGVFRHEADAVDEKNLVKDKFPHLYIEEWVITNE